MKISAYFIDLDGTILKHSSQEPLEGAVDLIQKYNENGDYVCFTTRRGGEEFGKDHPVYGEKITLATLDRLGLKYDAILFGVPSPRVVINDESCSAIKHVTNSAWIKNI